MKGEKFRFDSPPKAEEIEKDNKPAPINPFTQLPGLQSAIGVLNPQQLALPGKMAQQIPSSLLNMLPPPDPNPLAPSRLAQGLAAIAPPPRPLDKLDQETKKRMISISNLPLNIAQPQLRAFINQISIAMNIGEGVPGDPVKNVTITSGSPIGMVEFQTEDQATKALKLDGVELLGVKIKVQKAIFDANDNPTGLRGAMGIPGAAPGIGPEIRAPNVLPTLSEMMKTNKTKELAARPQQQQVKGDIDTKLALVNIPRFVQEKAINDLLGTFGKLKFYRLLTREEISDEKENIVFFEFFDPEMQVRAKTALQGLDLGKQSLVVMTPDEVLQSGKLVQKQKIGDRVIPTRILYLKNLVKPEDLFEDEDYEEICNDVRLECECFGEVVNLEVPRPHPDTKIKAEMKAREKAKENKMFLDRQSRIAKGEILLAIGDTSDEKKDKEEGEQDDEEKKRKEEDENEKERERKKEEETKEKVIQDVNPDDVKMKKEDEEEEAEEVEMEPNTEKKTSDSALKDESEVEKKEEEEEEEEKSLDPPGVGFAFVEFEDLEGASKAKKALNGRRFGIMEVVAEYFNEDKYEERDFEDVKPNIVAPKTQKVKPSEDAPEEEEIEFIW